MIQQPVAKMFMQLSRSRNCVSGEVNGSDVSDKWA